MTPGSTSLTPLLAFAAVVALIPLALWLLRRSGYGGLAPQGLLRTVASLPLSASQRLVVVELGQGEAARWLLLGVTAQSISRLADLDPPAAPLGEPSQPQAVTVHQLIARWRQGDGTPGEDKP